MAGYLWEHRLGLLGVAGLVALSSAFALAGPYLMGHAIDRYIKAGDLPGLAHVVGLMVLLYLLTSATTWGQQVVDDPHRPAHRRATSGAISSGSCRRSPCASSTATRTAS